MADPHSAGGVDQERCNFDVDGAVRNLEIVRKSALIIASGIMDKYVMGPPQVFAVGGTSDQVNPSHMPWLGPGGDVFRCEVRGQHQNSVVG